MNYHISWGWGCVIKWRVGVGGGVGGVCNLDVLVIKYEDCVLISV